ncbi:hypothetical protein HHI36_003427, partial [Cryptolaemus montrouzieri]
MISLGFLQSSLILKYSNKFISIPFTRLCRILILSNLIKSIHQAAEESLGELDNGRKKKCFYWWNDSIKESIEEKKRAYNKWLTTKDSEDRKYYTRISREVKKEIIKRKNEFWDAKCEEVDQYLGSSRSREPWRLLKNLRTNENSRPSLQPI